MRVLSTAVAMLLLFAASGLRASDDMPPSFLQPGHDYVLRFAGKSPFEQTEGIPIEPEYYKKPDAIITSARITSARITYSITVFTVVELFGDSWVLVEHPKSIKDAFKWNYKRFAMAALTPKTIAILEATEDGKVKLKNLRKQASVEIETDKTWINIDHVVAIAKPPAEPQEYTLNTKINAKE